MFLIVYCHIGQIHPVSANDIKPVPTEQNFHVVDKQFTFCSRKVDDNNFPRIFFPECDTITKSFGLQQNEIEKRLATAAAPIELTSSKNFPMRILIQDPHEVYGIGYECSQIVNTISFSQNFFGANSEDIRTTQDVTLTREQCKTMVLTKM